MRASREIKKYFGAGSKYIGRCVSREIRMGYSDISIGWIRNVFWERLKIRDLSEKI